MTDLSAAIAALPDKTLLLLDDDAALRTRLGRALEQRGFEPDAGRQRRRSAQPR